MKYLKKIIASMSINAKDIRIHIQKLIQLINEEMGDKLSEHLQFVFKHNLHVIELMIKNNNIVDEEASEKALEYINLAIQELEEEYNIIETNYWRERSSKSVIKLLRRAESFYL